MNNSTRSFISVFIMFFLLSLPHSINAAGELPLVNPNQMVSLDFQNAQLKDVLKIISIQSGLNFVASEGVKDRTVTVYFDKVPIQQAMDKLFEANNLSYEMDPEQSIFIVKDWGKPDVEVVTKVFYLKYASVSCSRLMDEVSSELGAAETTTSSSSTSGSTSDGGEQIEAGGSTVTTAIKKLLSKNGVVIEDYRTNSLIVQDVPSRMPIIAQTIAALDLPTDQVLIEVEMLDVNKNLVDKLGFKFGQTPLTMIWTGPKVSTVFPAWAPYSNLPFTKSLTAGTLDLNNSNSYKVLFDFLKTQSDTRYLARPSILTLNNETAEFKIETQETTSVTSTVVSGQTPTTGQTVNSATTGVTLRVTPQINPETGEITMFIFPKVKDTSTSSLSSDSLPIKDPEERTTKALVRIKDGETVIIGGLIRKQKVETITKLPFFGDLPFVGSAFRHKNKERDQERELMIFITPHIVKNKPASLMQAKPGFDTRIPAREQEAFSAVDRQAIVRNSLSGFDKK